MTVDNSASVLLKSKAKARGKSLLKERRIIINTVNEMLFAIAYQAGSPFVTLNMSNDNPPKIFAYKTVKFRFGLEIPWDVFETVLIRGANARLTVIDRELQDMDIQAPKRPDFAADLLAMRSKDDPPIKP